jgi:hypothetical protein
MSPPFPKPWPRRFIDITAKTAKARFTVVRAYSTFGTYD